MKLISTDEEIWKPVVGYENYYEVSNYGNCRSLVRKVTYKSTSNKDRKGVWKGKTLKPIETTCGYLKYQICLNGKCKRFFAHRLVAMAFLENKDSKRCVNHLDSNRKNNRLENLEWVTDAENLQHSYTHGKRENKFYGVCCIKKNIDLKKLISLKDYVLIYEPSRTQIFNYAKFLNTELKLEHFIVCDDEGNVLKEAYEVFERDCTECDEYIFRHQQSKERVIFEGYTVLQEKDYYIVVDSHGIKKWVSWNKSKTIESLINEITEVTITPNAVKTYQL